MFLPKSGGNYPDNKNDSEALENGTINSEVINTYTDYRIKKDYPTSPEM